MMEQDIIIQLVDISTKLEDITELTLALTQINNNVDMCRKLLAIILIILCTKIVWSVCTSIFRQFFPYGAI